MILKEYFENERFQHRRRTLNKLNSKRVYLGFVTLAAFKSFVSMFFAMLRCTKCTLLFASYIIHMHLIFDVIATRKVLEWNQQAILPWRSKENEKKCKEF